MRTDLMWDSRDPLGPTVMQRLRSPAARYSHEEDDGEREMIDAIIRA